MGDPEAYAEMVEGLGQPANRPQGLRVDAKGRLVPGRVQETDSSRMVAEIDDDELATYSSVLVNPDLLEPKPERRQGCGTVGIARLADVDAGDLKRLVRKDLFERARQRRAEASRKGTVSSSLAAGVTEAPRAASVRTDRRFGASATAAAVARPGVKTGGVKVNGLAPGGSTTLGAGGVGMGGEAAPGGGGHAFGISSIDGGTRPGAAAGLVGPGFGSAAAIPAALATGGGPALSNVDKTWYRYPQWRNAQAFQPEGAVSDSACPHPYKDAADYTVTYLDVCIPDVLDVAAAVSRLEAFDPNWRDALWGLVGLADLRDDDALAGNLASWLDEPLWYEWDEAATGYSPSVYESPRAGMFLRVLDLVRTFPEGVPKTFEGYDVHAGVVDVINAGGMSYRLYDYLEDESVADLFAGVDAVSSAADAVGEAWDALWLALQNLFLTYLAQVTVFNDMVGNFLADLRAALEGEAEESELDLLQIQVGLVIVELSLLVAALGPIWTFLLALVPGAVATAIAAAEALRTALDVASGALPLLKVALTSSDAENYIMEHYTRPALVSGALKQTSEEAPELTRTLALNLANSSAPYYIYDMSTVEFPWTLDGMVGEDTQSSANHGILPSETDPDLPYGSRVWLGNPGIERRAVAYDWFVGLAIRHYAVAQGTAGLDCGTPDNHLTAATCALRMALAACADISFQVLHETTHNLNLWHCRAPDANLFGFAEQDRAAGCVQDLVGKLFRAHVTARLGLPYAHWVDPNPPVATATGRYTVSWAIRTTTVGRCDVASSTDPTGRCCTPPVNAVQPINEGIECISIKGAAGLGALADVVIASAVAVVVAEALDLGAGFNTSASDAAVSLADLFAELKEDVATMKVIALDPNADSYSARVTYNIDRPLQMGGHVEWCCAFARSVCSDSDGPTPCWSEDAPRGYKGCGCAGKTLVTSC